MKLCKRCGQAPRWGGPNGTNKNLTMCESCQRAAWREAKKQPGKRRASVTVTERACTSCGQVFPLTEDYWYVRYERGTFRRQCKTCYDKRQVDRRSGTPKRPYHRRAQQRSDKTNPVRQKPPAPARKQVGDEVVRVLLVDHRRDVVQRFVVPVCDDVPLDTIRHAARLIEFYRHAGYVVVEVQR